MTRVDTAHGYGNPCFHSQATPVASHGFVCGNVAFAPDFVRNGMVRL